MSMSTAVKLTNVEWKQFRREPMSMGFGLAFPTILLIGLGLAIPSFREANPDLGGLRVIDVYVPIVMGMSIATLGLSVLPAYLAEYRHTGVLRRLAVTPAKPRDLLIAQLVVQLCVAIVAGAASVLAGMLIFDVRAPENPVALALAFVLAAAATFAVGLLIAAVAPSVNAASGIGMTVYFPMLFAGGVWTPGDAMPDVLRTISDFTPIGAGVSAMSDAWNGDWPQPLHLIVLVAYVLGASLAAAKIFRWE